MRDLAKNIRLPSIDDLFSTEEERQDAKLEKIQILPLSELHPFEGHPFQVRDDEEMDKMVDSVKEYGVMTPAIVRPRRDGGYEIVAGHRRCHASRRAGVDTMYPSSTAFMSSLDIPYPRRFRLTEKTQKPAARCPIRC